MFGGQGLANTMADVPNREEEAAAAKKKPSHTPGPWKALQHNWSDTSIYAENKLIARLTIYDEASEDTQEALEAEMSANATLIAAAPRMYEALQKLARLGNEPHYGNSAGNQIARDALQGLED